MLEYNSSCWNLEPCEKNNHTKYVDKELVHKMCIVESQDPYRLWVKIVYYARNNMKEQLHVFQYLLYKSCTYYVDIVIERTWITEIGRYEIWSMFICSYNSRDLGT